MSKISRALAATLMLAVVAALAVAGCGGGGDDTSSGGGSETGGGGGDPIVIGASIPQTGVLSSFGPFLADGYQQAAKEVNAAGGIEIDGEKRPVQIEIRDNKSDPNTAGEQIRSLALDDGAVAMTGGFTPLLSIPMSSAAERQRVPIVNTFTPINAFKAGNEAGWQYAWDFFFDDAAQGDQPFEIADDLVPDSNKKVAIIATNEDDGLIETKLWTERAPEHGYEIVSSDTVPVGTTDFSPFLDDIKSASPDVLIALQEPPGGIALWKQLKASGIKAELAFCYKCANNSIWPKSLGALADGTMAPAFWDSSFNRPETKELEKSLGAKYSVDTDLSTAVGAYTNVRVLTDAIEKAGSTEAEAINDAIAETDKAYPYMDIKFDDEHVAVLPPYYLQWQGEDPVVVWPAAAVEGKFQSPVKGLE